MHAGAPGTGRLAGRAAASARASRRCTAPRLIAPGTRRSGGRCSARAYACDVRDAAALDACYARVLREHGDVDVLVVNAGVNQHNRATHCLTPELVDTVVQTNLSGAIRMCVLPPCPHPL